MFRAVRSTLLPKYAHLQARSQVAILTVVWFSGYDTEAMWRFTRCTTKMILPLYGPPGPWVARRRSPSPGVIQAEDIQIVALRCGALGRKTPLSFSGWRCSSRG